MRPKVRTRNAVARADWSRRWGADVGLGPCGVGLFIADTLTRKRLSNHRALRDTRAIIA